MKKYVFSSLLFLLIAAVASAQCTQQCTKPSCDPSCQFTCTQVCEKQQILAGTPWQGQVEINGKTYAAKGKVYSTDKGTLASLSIADLKIVNEIFAVSKEKSSYNFVPKNELGFVAKANDFTVAMKQ